MTHVLFAGGETAPSNAAQMPRVHDAVAQRGEADEQRLRKRRQHRIRALNRKASPTGRRLRTGETEPVGGCTPSHNQPCSPTIERLEEVFPCDRMTAMTVRNRQHEIPVWFDGRNNKGVVCVGYGGHDVTGATACSAGTTLLELGVLPLVDEIPAVPARASVSSDQLQKKLSDESSTSKRYSPSLDSSSFHQPTTAR